MPHGFILFTTVCDVYNYSDPILNSTISTLQRYQLKPCNFIIRLHITNVILRNKDVKNLNLCVIICINSYIFSVNIIILCISYKPRCKFRAQNKPQKN